MVLQIFSQRITNRLEYTLDVIFTQILGLEYKLISDADRISDKVPLLNYSTLEFSNAIQILPHSLLFKETIEKQDIVIEDQYYFFKTNEDGLKFDIFALTFYSISRYEEYLAVDFDEHARFKAESSLAYQHNFLDKAVVNRWALELKQELLIQFPELVFQTQKYSYLSSIDVDNAFAFEGKGLIRLWGGLVKALLRKDSDDLKARFAHIFKGRKDPFDQFENINTLHKRINAETIFFFLVGKNGPYDKNISIQAETYQSLISNLANQSKIGIHPSYQSNSFKEMLSQEIEDLKSVISKDIKDSRQHFLKLSFPQTYQELIKNGIEKDYSMGFASQVGFRAGICTTYNWFNLKENSKTNLKIVPFQIMDGTLNDYLKLKPEQAVGKIRSIQKEVELVNGQMVTLWHNESLSEMRQWKNWTTVFEETLKICQAKN